MSDDMNPIDEQNFPISFDMHVIFSKRLALRI